MIEAGLISKRKKSTANMRIANSWADVGAMAVYYQLLFADGNSFEHENKF